MKKILLYLLILIFWGSITNAQNAQPDNEARNKGEKIKALYVAYMTKELSINETEAQKFWPVHQEYEQEMKSLMQKDMTELEREEGALNVKKKYQNRFSKIIGNDRTDDFYRKDGEFRKKLVEQIKKRRQQMNNSNRPFKRPRK
jgi:hypothetical protein